MTPEELNDAIRQYIDRTMPRPAGGFAHPVEEDIHRTETDAEYIRICALPHKEILALIGL